MPLVPLSLHFFFFFFRISFQEEGTDNRLEIMERENGEKILKRENKKNSPRVMRKREREFSECYLRG